MRNVLLLDLSKKLTKALGCRRPYTYVGQEEPGLTLSPALHEGVARQAQDVGVVEQPVHLHLRLRLHASLPVMTQDPLQGVETAVLSSFHQVHVAETADGGKA